MKRFLFVAMIAMVVALASVPAFAGTIWTENFESYTVGGNASSGGWIADTGTTSGYANTPGVISNDFAKSGSKAWKPGWNTTPKEASRIRKAVTLNTSATEFDLNAWVYTGSPKNVYRNFLGFQNASTTAVNNTSALVRLGANSGYGLVVHYWTTALQTYTIPTFTLTNDTWYNWNLGMVKNGANWDIVYTIKLADGSVASTGTAGTFAWDAANANYVVAGYTTGSSAPMYYDDISVSQVVPEPGSMLALGTGLIGLLGLIRRKKA